MHARQHVARVGGLALSYVGYGAEVEIDPGRLESFFLIHLVHSGCCEMRTGDEVVMGGPAMGSVTTATRPLAMRWSDDCAHLVLKIERAMLERHLADLLGTPVTRPIEFRAALPVGDGSGRRLPPRHRVRRGRARRRGRLAARLRRSASRASSRCC